MLIAQVSDSHVEAAGAIAHGVYDSHTAFIKALDQVAAVQPRPAFLLHTGDITHHGNMDVHRDVRAKLEATGIPYAVIPGNHDENEMLRAAFADKPWMPASGFLHFVIELPPIRIICLDSTIPGKVEGTLCNERMAWLAAKLAEAPTAPTMIAMHHPAFRIGRPTSDARPFGNPTGFAELVSRISECFTDHRRPRPLHVAGAHRQRRRTRSAEHGLWICGGSQPRRAALDHRRAAGFLSARLHGDGGVYLAMRPDRRLQGCPAAACGEACVITSRHSGAHRRCGPGITPYPTNPAAEFVRGPNRISGVSSSTVLAPT